MTSKTGPKDNPPIMSSSSSAGTQQNEGYYYDGTSEIDGLTSPTNTTSMSTVSSSSTAFPTSLSSLSLPSASHNFSQTLTQLKRSTLSITNRLRSICDDALFASEVAGAYGLPLVANERCGSWYIPPERKAGSAYFKSTDGHMGQWEFSLRRLNVQLLDLIGREDG